MRLEVNNLTKTFGEKSVLDNMNFTADAGSALGLLGRNGAGKTTAIRIIMNVFPPDSGEVNLNGRKLGSSGMRIGYLPEERGLYPKITIRRQLCYLARLRGLSNKDAAKAVEYWLERLEMSEYTDKKLETLSKGNQQKIQLALALLASPEIVILDEPFSGLDPVNSRLLKEVITEQVNEGKIVIFSSHQMGYIEEFCDDVAILNGGRIVLSGDLREIKRGYDRSRIEIRLDGPAGATREVLARMKQQAGPGSILSEIVDTDDGCIVKLRRPEQRNQLLQSLAATGIPVDRFNVLEPTLEDIFIEKASATV
ncbi:MAG: ABC transporter ATP-binding protein [Saccharofermentanales bacterium]